MIGRRALTCTLFFALAAMVALPAAAPAAKLKLRIAKETARTVIPDSDPGAFFDYSQRFSAACRGSERALSPGLISSWRHVVSLSFGPRAVAGFTVGNPGRVSTKVQVLCASGAPISHRRKPARITGGSSTSLTVAARSTCGRKAIAIGAALSQDFSPGTGRFLSRPTANGGWEVRAQDIPSTFPFALASAAYADHACLPKRFLGAIKVESGSTSALVNSSTARLNLTCKGARRALGWGIDLKPLAHSRYTTGSDGWSIPYLRKAQIAGKKVKFLFARPPAMPVTVSGSAAAQTAYVICGVPR